LTTLVAELGPKARAATVVEAAKAGDVVVVTILLKHYRNVPVASLAGKVVIDTMNYYPQRDGQIPDLDNESTTTSELLQAHLPTSKSSRRSTTSMPRSSRPTGDPPARRTVGR
jgi:predicted dinucleotide-binding enzyme